MGARKVTDRTVKTDLTWKDVEVSRWEDDDDDEEDEPRREEYFAGGERRYISIHTSPWKDT